MVTIPARAKVAALLISAAALGGPASLPAQCTNPWPVPWSSAFTLFAFNQGTAGGRVTSLTGLPGGGFVAGGNFAFLGVTANNIALYDGTSIAPLGSGLSSTSYPNFVEVYTAQLKNGDIVAVGFFDQAGGVAVNNAALWDGTSWSPMGGGIGRPALAVTAMPNGDAVAAYFTGTSSVVQSDIARWDGTSWSPLCTGLDGHVHDLATMQNGDLIAAGSFQSGSCVTANRIARFDGTSWTTLGNGMNGTVHVLLPLPNGHLVAGGDFTSAGAVGANRIALWDGTAWSAFGSGINGPVTALVVLPNGDIVAGGTFFMAGGNLVSGTARWDGASWSPFGFVMDRVEDMARLTNGDIAISVTDFYGMGTVRAFTTACPASAPAHGAGCAGSAGLNRLRARSLPWTGTTFRSAASGLTTNALALGLVGLGTTSVPLSSLVAQALPGCTQYVTPDALQLYLPAGGGFDLQLAIPNSSAFAGIVLYQQVIAAELDAQNAITAVTSTNALTLTIGTF